MKSFLKYTLATITGLILASVLFFFIMLGSLSIMMSSANKPVTIEKNSVLVLNTGITIPERGLDDPLATFDYADFTFKPTPGVNDIVKNLEKAAGDDNIKGLLIENGPMVNGWGKAEEIRMAIERFKESGKFVIAYTDYILTQEAYYISTAADSIFMNPSSLMEFKGISSEVMFYKDALDKLGVNVEVIRHGKFKGAVEPFMGNSLSKENRSQINRFINNIWGHALEGISVSRGISIQDLNEIADRLDATEIEKALDYKMIDGLIYRDQLQEILKEKTGDEGDDDPSLVSMYKYTKVPSPGVTDTDGKIAVVYAEGTIVMGKGNDSNIGANYYASVISDIRKSGDYKAIVFRINSPGGNAMASDLLWREVSLTAEQIPVVVSMSNYAASGGYYIAAPATKIVSLPTTLTGSIGVFGMFPQAQTFLNKKLGISTEVVSTNKYSDSPSFVREMDPYEVTVMQRNVDKTYDEFVTRVSDGRGIPKTEVDNMGGGHVYTGNDALDNGLVDRIGGIMDAIDEAASLASVENYSIAEFPEIEDTYTRLMKTLGGEMKLRILSRELGVSAEYYNDLKEITGMQGVQARLPWFIRFK